MLRTIISISFFLFFILNTKTSLAQADRDSTEVLSNKIVVITTNSGGEFVGIILFQDAKEVLIETKDRGKVSIPKYEIQKMREVSRGQLNANGEFISEDIFATRYFFTTNGLPLEKGESYMLYTILGPEIHFGVAKNLTIGIMTSWIGIPIIT